MLPHGLADRLRALADRPDGRRLDRDPLGLVRQARDKETAALLGALLAFGNARSIRRSLATALEAVDAGRPLGGRFRHRWVSGTDVDRLLGRVAGARARHGSLEDLFLEGDDGDLGHALDRFAGGLRGPRPSRGLRFLLPRPEDGSACKRPLLFLRWVVRSRGDDLGLWRRVDPARLLVPLDTHVHRIAYWLGLTSRKTPSWKTALEVTASLREADARDPARFDFALAHMGILGDCPRSPLPSKCAPCPLRPWCRAWAETS
ncbi:MAG TPA: DUF2400 family protein [Planctomycetota bacterium]|nr:DUF2400 family protein [Planctomycetota bacterium]